MKKLTGGVGKFRFERKHENSYESTITFTIWLDGNSVARARVEDNPLFDRWKLTPFKHRIKTPDKKWLEKNADAEYRAAVLAWIMKGRRGWKKAGIGSEPIIEQSIDKIRMSMDPLKDFWRQELRFGDEGWFCTTNEVRERYVQWVHARGDKPMNDPDFQALWKAKRQAKGTKTAVRRVERKSRKGWGGVRLRRR
jgi:phage/plasmid-associated DNA primase